jgi:branched-chain amino acid transport system substrate-binding protein
LPSRSWASAALVAALIVAGCGGGEEPGDATLRVYVSLPLRGASGADGRDAADGARLALADAGGEAGGLAVEAVVLDDTGETAGGARWSPVRAAGNARTAIQDSSAIAYLGDFESGATRASLPVTNEASLLQVSPASGAVDLVAPFPGSDDVPDAQPSGERTFGRVIPSDDAQAEAAAGWARGLGWDRVAVVDDGSRFGETLAGAFADEARELGIATGPGGGTRVYLAGAASGRSRQALASDAFLPPYRRRAPAGLMPTSAALDPAQLPPAGRDFAQRFEEEYGRAPGRYAAYGYEAMAVTLDSIERASDPADRDAVVDAFFETTERESILGTYSVDELGETTLAEMSGYRIGGGGRARAVAELSAAD